MTRYQKIAAKAVKYYVESDDSEPKVMFDVACVADQAAYQRGKKTEMFGSLWDYVSLLPPGWRVRWLSAEGGSDSMAYAVHDKWSSGNSRSQTLVLGGGRLVESSYLD